MIQSFIVYLGGYIISDSIFYVYILFDWMGIPRYVGKGKGNRDISHEKGGVPGNWIKDEFIERTWIMLGEIPKIRIRERITEEDAFKLERTLIKTIGRLDNFTGPLTNQTDGGFGLPADRARLFAQQAWDRMTPEQRRERGRRISESLALLPPEQRRASANKREITMTDVQRLARISNGLTAFRNMTPEQRKARGQKAGPRISAGLMRNLTKEQRSTKARNAALARHKKTQCEV